MPWSELAIGPGFADELGFDGIWGFDHFQPMYGDGPGECFEGNTTLAAWSGITEQRAPRPARHRDDLPPSRGVRGRGDHHRPRVERPARARPTARRGSTRSTTSSASRSRRCRSGSTRSRRRCRSCAGLLTTDGFTFEGQHFQVHDATLLPRPVQQPHPPIWIGASGEKRMMPIAARYADVWHCFGPSSISTREVAAPQRAGGAGRPRPGDDHAGRVALARGRPRHDRGQRRRVGSRRVRVPRVRLAARRPRARSRPFARGSSPADRERCQSALGVPLVSYTQQTAHQGDAGP